MKIMEILVRDAVLLDLAGTTKAEVLEELARALGAAEPGLDVDRLLAVLRGRGGRPSTRGRGGGGRGDPGRKDAGSSAPPGVVRAQPRRGGLRVDRRHADLPLLPARR